MTQNQNQNGILLQPTDKNYNTKDSYMFEGQLSKTIITNTQENGQNVEKHTRVSA